MEILFAEGWGEGAGPGWSWKSRLSSQNAGRGAGGHHGMGLGGKEEVEIPGEGLGGAGYPSNISRVLGQHSQKKPQRVLIDKKLPELEIPQKIH